MPLEPGSIVTGAHLYTPDEERAIRAQLGSRLIAAVQKNGGNTQSTIIYRDLLATDVQTGTRWTNANATGLSATTYVSLLLGSAGFALPVNQAIGIYGYMSLDAAPLIDILKFMLGASGTPLAVVNVAQTYGDARISKSYFTPQIWKPQETLDVQALSNSAVAQNASSFLLLGLIAEPIGKTITPRQDLADLTPS